MTVGIVLGWLIFGRGRLPAHTTVGDVLVAYYPAHSALLSGLRPYRDFPYEYPPLTLVSLALPPLAVPAAVFVLCWIMQMLALDWLVFRGLTRLVGASRSERAEFAVFTWVAGGLLLLGLGLVRNDLIACAPVVWAFVYLQEGGGFRSGLLLGLGILAKGWPVFVVAAVLAIVGKRFGARLLTGVLLAATAVVPLAAAGLLVPALRSLTAYHGGRSLEIEALAARPFQMLGAVTGRPPVLSEDHGSVNLSGHVELGSALTVVGIVVVVTVLARRYARRPRGAELLLANVGQLSLMSLVIVLCFAKVFSPQYVLWLLAVAAAAAAVGGVGRRELALVLGCAALTTAVFPISWEGLRSAAPWAVFIAVCRDAVLLGLLAAVVGRSRRLRAGQDSV